MKLCRKDVKVETIRGQGPGGQHRNKTDSCVRMTHLPTGLQVTVDARSQQKNRQVAWKELQTRLDQLEAERRAARRKAKRDTAIRETAYIRTYDYKSGVVHDHRTGKTASLKNVLVKGRIGLLA